MLRYMRESYRTRQNIKEDSIYIYSYRTQQNIMEDSIYISLPHSPVYCVYLSLWQLEIYISLIQDSLGYILITLSARAVHDRTLLNL